MRTLMKETVIDKLKTGAELNHLRCVIARTQATATKWLREFVDATFAKQVVEQKLAQRTAAFERTSSELAKYKYAVELMKDQGYDLHEALFYARLEAP